MLLAGIFNRLGDRKSDPYKVKPPKLVLEWQREHEAKLLNLGNGASDIEMIRGLAQRFFAQQNR